MPALRNYVIRAGRVPKTAFAGRRPRFTLQRMVDPADSPLEQCSDPAVALPQVSAGVSNPQATAAAGSDGPIHRFRWWIVFLLFSNTFINALDRASLSTAAPTMMKELGLDAGKMGIALSAFFWFYLIMNIPAGRLADRYGAKRTLGWAAGLWSLCSALTGSASHYLHIVLARIGVGIGEAASFPVNARIIANSFRPQERGTATGLYISGLRLGFAVTPVLMAYLISAWGWRFAFYVTGLGSLLWVILWCSTFKEDRTAPTRTQGGLKIPWLELLRNRTVLGLVLCKFFQDYLFYLFVTWLPGYLIIGRKFTIMKMGWYASLPWLAGFLAQPLFGSASDWLVRRGVSLTLSRKGIIIAMQLLAASAIVAGYAHNAMTAVWLLTLSVACESAATSVLWATCTDVAPPFAAGSLAGVMNTAGALAGILAPVTTGFLVEFTGSFQPALLMGGCMVLLAALSMAYVVDELKPLPFSEHPRQASSQVL
jgi:MFS transporter, ACS family, D-galactonate transporter